jgi:VanZ family protein
VRKAVVLYALPALAWMGAIFYWSSLQEAGTPLREVVPDYVAHAAVYFVLAFFLFIFLHRVHERGLAVTFCIALIIGALYALSDEWHQSYVPTRSCSAWDFLADIVGMTICFLLLAAVRQAGSMGRRSYALLAGRP